MANSAKYEVRKLFTEIGCIMEDASLVALVWKYGDRLDLKERLHSLSDAHEAIGDLLAQIERVC